MKVRRQLTTHCSPLTRSNLSLRSGFTLIEMAVVVAILSVVMVLATTTLTTLFRVQRQIAGDAAQDLAIARLAKHWRADAHEAIEASTDAGCSLVLTDGRTIQYAFSEPAIVREVRRGSTIEHRDAFVLPRRAEVRFSIAPLAGGQVVRAAIAPTETTNRAYAIPIRAIQIDAAVNLRHMVAKEAQP